MLEVCARLLSEKQFERYVLHLFDQPAGRWDNCASALEKLEIDLGHTFDSIYAVWLDSSSEEEGYVFVLFYDQNSGGTLSAEYNRALLMRSQA